MQEKWSLICFSEIALSHLFPPPLFFFFFTEESQGSLCCTCILLFCCLHAYLPCLSLCPLLPLPSQAMCYTSWEGSLTKTHVIESTSPPGWDNLAGIIPALSLREVHCLTWITQPVSKWGIHIASGLPLSKRCLHFRSSGSHEIINFLCV